MYYCLMVACLVALSRNALAQNALPKGAADSVWIVPGAKYKNIGILSPFRGQGYRSLWTDSLRVPVANLALLGGGLTPVRAGSFAMTWGLEMRGQDSYQYVFQAVDKDPFLVLPKWLRIATVSQFAEDLMGAFHPTGALIVNALEQELGIPHFVPRLYVLPDDPRLLDYREVFGGRLVWMDRIPVVQNDWSSRFAGARGMVTTEALLDSLMATPDHQLDRLSYLKARLLDMFVGDGNRNGSNWRWLRYDAEDGTLWQALPTNREMAFIHADGLNTWALRSLVPGFFRYDPKYPGQKSLTRTAWDLDRPLLSPVAKTAWDSVVVSVQSKLTDQVIEHAVAQMPPSQVRRKGEWLVGNMKSRRDRLHEAADEFYKVVAEYAVMELTNSSEVITVERLSDEVQIRVALRGDASDSGAVKPLVQRLFKKSETKEIRLYCNGGNDLIRVSGAGNASIKVRIVGGEGDDELVDLSREQGARIYFYDDGARTQVSGGSKLKHYTRDSRRPILWKVGLQEAQAPDWGSQMNTFSSLDFSGDNGLKLSGGINYDRLSYLKQPYQSRLRGAVTYASRQNRFAFDLQHDYRGFRSQNLHSLTALRISAIDVIRFYGFGNETPADQPEQFYEVNSTSRSLRWQLRYSRGEKFDIGMGVFLDFSDTDTSRSDRSLIAFEKPYGSGRFRHAGVEAQVRLTSEDESAPFTKGFRMTGGAGYYPETLEVSRGAFGEIHGELVAFAPLLQHRNPILFTILRGKKIFGEAPFTRAAVLGGSKSLRGFPEGRFTGQASLYASLELQTRVLRQYGFLFPTDLGIVAFTDAGRVFLPGEASHTIHWSAGAGLWATPTITGFKKLAGLRLQAEIAYSVEQVAFYFRTGYRF